MPFLKLHITLLFLLIASCCIGGNPAIRGSWKGYLLSNTEDSDNRKGLPCSLFIIDDNDEGYFTGEMTVQYRYQTDIYKAKYTVQGMIDYEKYSIYLKQTKMVYYDLLPKGLQWCFGSGTFSIYRSIYGKKTYMDGPMNSTCGNEKMRLILIKM
jgi:hypothetical protein